MYFRFLLLLSKHPVGLYNWILEKTLSQLAGNRRECLQTYGVWFSKCFGAVNNKYVMMTIQKLPVALEYTFAVLRSNVST